MTASDDPRDGTAATVEQAGSCVARRRGPGLEPDGPFVQAAVDIFAMLADATRVRIVLALLEDELPVGRLAEIVGKSPTAVSQHLSKMRLAALVTTRQDGTRVFYRLANEHAAHVVAETIRQAEHATVAHPPHHAGE